MRESNFILYLDAHAAPWAIIYSPFLWGLGGALLIYPSFAKYKVSPGRKPSLIIASSLFVSVIFLLAYYFYLINWGLGESKWDFFGPFE